MPVLKLFKNGTSQAVRIPKEMEFPGDRVRVQRHKDGLLILPEPTKWEEVFAQIDECGTCSIDAPDDPPPAEID